MRLAWFSIRLFARVAFVRFFWHRKIDEKTMFSFLIRSFVSLALSVFIQFLIENSFLQISFCHSSNPIFLWLRRNSRPKIEIVNRNSWFRFHSLCNVRLFGRFCKMVKSKLDRINLVFVCAMMCHHSSKLMLAMTYESDSYVLFISTASTNSILPFTSNNR